MKFSGILKFGTTAKDCIRRWVTKVHPTTERNMREKFLLTRLKVQFILNQLFLYECPVFWGNSSLGQQPDSPIRERGYGGGFFEKGGMKCGGRR